MTERVTSVLDKKFSWIASEPGPAVLLEAWKLIGIYEGIGNLDNPEILAWAKEVGLEKVYAHDSIAWCGLFAAVVAKRAGLPVPKDPLWAANWLHVGEPVDREEGPKLADVLVFDRPGGHHVGHYVGETDIHYFVLGGNESDGANVVPIFKDRLHGAKDPKMTYGARRPAYPKPPANLRKVLVTIDGVLIPSTNEA